MELSNRILHFVVCLLASIYFAPLTGASDWQTVVTPARPLNITANHGVFWVCGTDEYIGKSSDGGKTWNTVHSAKGGQVLLTIGFANEQLGYAAGTEGLMVTKDGGATWSPMPSPGRVIYQAAFADEKHGLIQTPHSVDVTSDGGTTWTPVKLDYPDDSGQGKYSYVLMLVAVDAQHMAIVTSVGNASYFAEKSIMTADGTHWAPVEIPSTSATSLAAIHGEYWFAGTEVINKDKPGGGYGVALVMHSKDGQNWTHFPRWTDKEFSSCNATGCLYWDGAGVEFPPGAAPVYWKFAAEKAVTAKWAVAADGICSVGADLKCAPLTRSATLPSYDQTSSPIPTRLAPPSLDAPATQGLQCILCDTDRVIVTDDYAGLAEVDLALTIGANGVVSDVQVDHATKPEIGERVASEARNWVFVPYEKEGVIHPVQTHINVKVQAIKSK